MNLRDLRTQNTDGDSDLFGEKQNGQGASIIFCGCDPDDAYDAWTDEDDEDSLPSDEDPPSLVHEVAPAQNEPGPSDAPVLGDDFWDARTSLLRIRNAAHAQQCSAGFFLEIVLARVAAAVPCELQLPAPIGAPRPLSLFVAGVAPSGVGKTVGNDNARAYFPITIPDVADQLPLGSGEGLVEAFFDWVEEQTPDGKTVTVKKQTRYGAYYYVDEGQVLADLANRKGATLLPTIRAMFSGAQVGNTNAARDTRRLINPGHYTVGLVVAVQPRLAGALLDDADAGTPQRFLWAHAADPNIPDQPTTWPPEIEWTPPSAKAIKALRTVGRFGGRRIPALKVAAPILDEIRQTGLARARGAMMLDELDAHATLVRFKVAGLLALLERRVDVNADDWRLADNVMDYSNAVRTGVLAELRKADQEREGAATARLTNRRLHADAAIETRRIIDCARRIAAKVHEREWLRRDLFNHLRRWRDVFDEGLEHASAESWVIEAVEPGQGSDKRVLRPGPTRAT